MSVLMFIPFHNFTSLK